MNRRSSIKSSILYTFLTKLVLIFLKLGVSIITARFLGPAGRGIYFSIIQFAGIINTIGSISIGEGLIYYFGKNKLKRENLLCITFSLSIFFSLIVIFFLYLTQPLINKYLFEELNQAYFNILSSIIFFMLFEYITSSAMKGLHLFSTVNKLTIISRTVIMFSIFLGLFFISPDALTAIKAFLVAHVINFIFYFGAALKCSDYRFKVPNLKKIKLFSFSLKTHLPTVLTEAEYRIDIFILLYFINAAAVGIYSIGVTISQLVWYISNSVNTVLYPYIASSGSVEAKSITAKALRLNLFINLIAILGLVFFGYYLIIFLFGAEFEKSYLIFLILTPGLLIDSFSRNITSWLKGIGKPEIISKIVLFSLVLNIILNIFLIPYFGITGAAISSSLTYITKAFFMIKVFLNKSDFSLNDIFLPKKNEVAELITSLKEITIENFKKIKIR